MQLYHLERKLAENMRPFKDITSPFGEAVHRHDIREWAYGATYGATKPGKSESMTVFVNMTDELRAELERHYIVRQIHRQAAA